MKQFTHAWLAFMAIKRLEDKKLSLSDDIDRKSADSLIEWFKSHKDGVIRGAWYPDALIKDMANSHVLKITPSDEAAKEFKPLPAKYLSYRYGKSSPVRNMAFEIDLNDNLRDRCESIAESVIDHLKVQENEEKGSPVSPTDNQVALWLFMLSHYVADAHVPLHCDSRQFSEGKNIHGEMEGEWDDEIERYYKIDASNERFFYDPRGYPLKDSSKDQEYQSSYLKKVDDELSKREFTESFGTGNKNVWDFMSAICQHSYLLSYYFLPPQYDHTNVTLGNWQSLGSISFEELSVAIFSDTIDSIARIWFRVWRRYVKWEREQRSRK